MTERRNVRFPSIPVISGLGPLSTQIGHSEQHDLGCPAMWMRFSHVSWNTAVVTGPTTRGGWVKVTPRPTNRSFSAASFSTPIEVNGIPSAMCAALNGLAAGCSSGSGRSRTPFGSSDETNVSHHAGPSGCRALARSRDVAVEVQRPFRTSTSGFVTTIFVVALLVSTGLHDRLGPYNRPHPADCLAKMFV